MTIDGILVVFELMRPALDREQGVAMKGRMVRSDTHASFKTLVFRLFCLPLFPHWEEVPERLDQL